MNATATAEAPTVESAAAAVRIRGLTKVYGDVRALDGVDLDVPRGS
ncbi:MAG: ABC transporter ATP-binding protein, partial [Coriobacteriia bacterium]|nr:ABC transporter ATP-binding protein [Coriobacteriia bacterium]